MNPTDPNDVKELVTLSGVLKDNGFGVAVYDDNSGVLKAQTLYGFHYAYPVLGEKDTLGKAFEQVAKGLVTVLGGEVSPVKSSAENGFWADFPDDKKRMDFLTAFSVAASSLNTPPKPVYTPPKSESIVKTPNGFILGARSFSI